MKASRTGAAVQTRARSGARVPGDAAHGAWFFTVTIRAVGPEFGNGAGAWEVSVSFTGLQAPCPELPLNADDERMRARLVGRSRLVGSRACSVARLLSVAIEKTSKNKLISLGT
jgi:hypothetical protein